MQRLVFLQKITLKGEEMACINADGTISGSAKEILNLISNPHTFEEKH